MQHGGAAVARWRMKRDMQALPVLPVGSGRCVPARLSLALYLGWPRPSGRPLVLCSPSASRTTSSSSAALGRPAGPPAAALRRFPPSTSSTSRRCCCATSWGNGRWWCCRTPWSTATETCPGGGPWSWPRRASPRRCPHGDGGRGKPPGPACRLSSSSLRWQCASWAPTLSGLCSYSVYCASGCRRTREGHRDWICRRSSSRSLLRRSLRAPPRSGTWWRASGRNAPGGGCGRGCRCVGALRRFACTAAYGSLHAAPVPAARTAPAGWRGCGCCFLLLHLPYCSLLAPCKAPEGRTPPSARGASCNVCEGRCSWPGRGRRCTRSGRSCAGCSRDGRQGEIPQGWGSRTDDPSGPGSWSRKRGRRSPCGGDYGCWTGLSSSSWPGRRAHPTAAAGSLHRPQN